MAEARSAEGQKRSHFLCSGCGKQFADNAHLARHKNKKRHCGSRSSVYRCRACGAKYAHARSLSRHQRQCSSGGTSGSAPSLGNAGGSLRAVTLVQTIQNIQVNALGADQKITIAPVGNTINQIDNTREPRPRHPGWPDRWPVPSVPPQPFNPLSFKVGLPELEEALMVLPAESRAACARGDTAAVAQLMIGILRQVHARPEERNVYLNPCRSDQALVFAPNSWETCPLDEAGQALFSRIARNLGSLPINAQPAVKSVASSVRQSCAEKLPQLAKASRSRMTAHLENMRRQLGMEGDWLSLGNSEEELSFFGEEWTAHLSPEILATAAANAAGVYLAADITEGAGITQTARALTECARYVLRGQTINLVVLPCSSRDDEVYVHDGPGWVLRPSLTVSKDLFRRMAAILDDLLDGVPPDTPLLAIRPWLKDRLPEVLESDAGQESAKRILFQYSAAAYQYFVDLPPRPNPRDRREIARKIVCEELGPPARAIATDSVASPSGPSPRQSAPTLTDDDIAALLGFEWA